MGPLDIRDAATRPDPYRELFDRSADAILIIEGETFVDCNDAAVRMLRCATKADVLRTHPSELSPPLQPDGRDSFEKANEMMALAFENGSHRFEWSHRRADGEVFPVEVLLTAIEEPDRRVLHVVWRDITQRRLLEDSLRHAQKMDAVGKLAGGIAHDFNNLLVVILGHVDLLETAVIEDAEVRDNLRQIRGAGERAARLVKQLLAFGRKQQLLPETLDLNTLVADLRPLLERLAGADLAVKIERTAEALPVDADRGQIEQVLMNLASNARDATPGGGVLRIRTERVEPQASDASEIASRGAGSYALVSVTDTGTGMDRSVAAKACDPFFTTKGRHGTGLGLSTAHGIVEQSGGSLDIESTPGVGTTVRVFLPVSSKKMVEDRRGVRSIPVRGGAERILVVEDEAVVRRVILAALRAKGYEVWAAEDGAAGQEVYESEGGHFDLIVSDVIMPRATGPEMVAALEARGFHPKVLFLSGYTNDALTARHRLQKGVNLLPKPFTTQELASRVRGALDGPVRQASVS